MYIYIYIFFRKIGFTHHLQSFTHHYTLQDISMRYCKWQSGSIDIKQHSAFLPLLSLLGRSLGTLFDPI